MSATINYGLCNNCGRCYLICPMDVYVKEVKKVLVRHNEDCMACYLCEIECPVEGAVYVDPRRTKPMPTPF